MGLQSMARELGVGLALHAYTDSSAAVGICEKQGLRKTRHLDVALFWIQGQLARDRFQLSKVDGENNAADILTKPAEGGRIRKFIENLGV